MCTVSTNKTNHNGYVTTDIVSRLCSHFNREKCHVISVALNENMDKHDIKSKLQVAHFLAQILHESNMLKATSENLNYSAKALKSVFGKYFQCDEDCVRYARKPEKIANLVYANRMGNGTINSGDGWRYRGRGLIQLTGKNNYIHFNKTVDLDVVANPDLVSSDPDLCVASACWFWQKNKLNEFADHDDVVKVTRRINGGINGLAHRKELLLLVKKLLNQT
ncbi:hypothetical protein BS333_15275 [Vibrio azureus]|nr:hypothetical protein BS333_15275 [Vibrio azureus]